MTVVAENVKSTGEGASVTLCFLGASVPTGAQTVSVSHTGTPAKFGGAITVTADGDVEITDSDATISSDSVDDPSVTLSLAGATAFAAIGFFSGQAATTSNTPLSGWTNRADHDFGASVAGMYSYDTIGTTDVTAGWTTAAADDAVAVALAVNEIAGGGATVPKFSHHQLYRTQ